MPLGFERLNERSQRPNALINFIKPLEGPHKATSEEFLSRIAAQCYPVMKKHHISVMALEEYAPNPEFLGRNFNAGEVIQLVLKDRLGRWLSMKFVQMVMMHELAHCKQMNHSRFFWTVRNEYAKQMEDLWRDKYTGEGLWGLGRGLENGSFIHAVPPDNSQIPEHLCGGSYRRRGRKRKRGQNSQEQPEKLTYAERQQRRISRKFGKHGDGSSLGEDDLLRGALETGNGGKRGQGKPRVANSKRGRELRAAAALARFGQAKIKEETPELEHLDSDTESEWEEGSSTNGSDSSIIKDDRGRDLIKVCGDGEDDEDGASKELDELRMLSATPKGLSALTRPKIQPARGLEGHEDSETGSDDDKTRPTPPTTNPRKPNRPRKPPIEILDTDSETDPETNDTHSPRPSKAPTTTTDTTLPAEPKPLDNNNVDKRSSEPPLPCPICSLENPSTSPTCTACSNVLHPNLMPHHWRCQSTTCKSSKYINAGDMGRCGLCEAQKPKTSVTEGQGMGVMRAEVLRWD